LAFRGRFESAPAGVTFANGRVNLLGEHVDHQGGVVLPIALPEGVAVAWGPRPDRAVRLVSLDARMGDRFPLDRPGRCGRRFADLVRGVADVLTARGRRLPGVDLVVASDLPMRRGLASSAAYLVAVLRAFHAVSGAPAPDARELAALVGEIERLVAGVPCGAMDPIASALGVVGAPIRLDCASLEVERLPWPDDALVTAHDTGVERELSDTPYADRVRELEAGLGAVRAARPGLSTLRELDPAALLEIESCVSEPARARVRHVVTEMERVRRAVDAIRAGDLDVVGGLLRESHASLARDFAASTPAIDALVEEVDRAPGVLGARLQGAGWGGSLVVLQRRQGPSHSIQDA